MVTLNGRHGHDDKLPTPAHINACQSDGQSVKSHVYPEGFPSSCRPFTLLLRRFDRGHPRTPLVLLHRRPGDGSRRHLACPPGWTPDVPSPIAARAVGVIATATARHLLWLVRFWHTMAVYSESHEEDLQRMRRSSSLLPGKPGFATVCPKCSVAPPKQTARRLTPCSPKNSSNISGQKVA